MWFIVPLLLHIRNHHFAEKQHSHNEHLKLHGRYYFQTHYNTYNFEHIDPD